MSEGAEMKHAEVKINEKKTSVPFGDRGVDC